MNLGEQLGIVLKELTERDINLAEILRSGEWTVILSKRDYVIMNDHKNSKSLHIYRTGLYNKHNRKIGTQIAWHVEYIKYDKQKALDKYKRYKKKKGKYLVAKRKVDIDRKKLSEIELIKRQIEVLKDIRRFGYNLSKGDKISLTKKIKKLEKKLEELTI